MTIINGTEVMYIKKSKQGCTEGFGERIGKGKLYNCISKMKNLKFKQKE